MARTELFLQALRNRANLRLPDGVLCARFAPFVVNRNRAGLSKLAFGKAPGSTVMRGDDEADRIYSSLGFTNEPEHLQFWEVIAGLLKDFPVLLHWPMGSVAGNKALVRHIPRTYIECFGKPLITTDPETIRAEVRRRRVFPSD